MDPSLLTLFSPDRQLLVLAAAATAGLTVMVLVRALDLHLRVGPDETKALARYLAPYLVQEERTAPLSVEPDRVIAAALGLKRPEMLRHIRLAAAAAPALALLAAGFPWVPALGAGGLCYVLVDSWLQGHWRRFRSQVEAELPNFVSRLGGMLLVTESATHALEEVLATLDPDSPLRIWMEAFLVGVRREGTAFLAEAREHAAQISPSLALVVFEIGRFFETGGAGFVQAFVTTAEELSAILEVRAVAGAKAEAARSGVLMLLAIIGVIVGLMLSSPSIRQGFADPTAQMVALASVAVMAYGYVFMNGMIRDALE